MYTTYAYRQPMAAVGYTLAPPSAFQSCWYYSLYTQIAQQQLYEYQSWFMSMDRDRSGTISNLELQSLVIGGFPLGLETATKLIKVFDHNRNGQIDIYEYMALHQFVNNLYRCFVVNDRNLSGTIDAYEIHNSLNTAGFILPFHTVNLFFLKYSPLGTGLIFTQYLSLCASIALARSLFEWNDPMRTGMIHVGLSQLYDMFALV